MLDFDFNSVKKVPQKESSKIILFDSICEDLKKFFDAIFTNNIKWIFKKENSYIRVLNERNNELYIRKEENENIIKEYNKISQYLKFIKLDKSCELMLNTNLIYGLYKTPTIISALKNFNSIDKISIFGRDLNFPNYEIVNRNINDFNDILSKNNEIYFNIAPIVDTKKSKERNLKIYSKTMIWDRSDYFVYNADYFVYIARKKGYFIDFYSNNIILKFLSYTNNTTYLKINFEYFLEGLRKFDDSIKNDDAIITAYISNNFLDIYEKLQNFKFKHKWIWELDYKNSYI